MSIGLLQAILVALGDLVYVGIQCEHPFLFILSAMLNSVAFTLIVYSLVFALDSVGLGAVVVLLVTQVAGGGGSFPIQVLPTPFRILSNIMPMHYGYEAMRECIGGMYGLNYWKNVAIMMLIALVFVPFSLLIHKPMRKIIEKAKESEEASDIME
jgi:putative membrane protein